MKKINLLLTMLAMYCLCTNAAVIELAEGSVTIEDAISSAMAGDTIVLTTSGGAYEQGEFTIDKSITIKAADGLAEMPVITAESDDESIFKINDSFKLVLEGLELSGGKFAIRCASLDSTTTTSVEVYDCYGHDFDQRFFTVDAEGAKSTETPSASGMDSIIIRNSIFSDIGKEAIVFYSGSSSDAGIPLNYAEVSNCTFYNIEREAIKSQTSEVKEVYVNQCTFYNCGGSSKQMIYFKNLLSAEITNCIFMGNAKSDSWMRVTENTLVRHVIFYDVVNKKISEGDDEYIMDTLYIDPLFIDAVNGDFTLQLSSPALTYGDQGQAVGDYRWVVEPTGFVFSPKKVSFDVAGGEETVMFFSDAAWTAQVESSASSWLSITASSGNALSDPANFVVIAGENPDFEERTAKVYGLQGGEKKDSLMITQAGKIALEIVAQDDMQFSGVGETQTVTMNAGLDWSITSTETWISFNPASGTAGDNQVIDVIAAANSGDYRTATVTLTAGSSTEEIAINQLRAALTPEWTVYDCEVLPSHFSSAFELEDIPSVEQIVDNSVLRFAVSKDQEGVFERQDFEENTDFDTYDGFTLMAKIKGHVDSTRVIEFELKGGEYREKIKIEDDRVKLDKGKSIVDDSKEIIYPGGIDILNNFVTFRMAFQRGTTRIWVDDQYLGTFVSTTTDSKGELFGFGDSSDSYSYGVDIDWMMWDLTGAYAPGEGADIPLDKQVATKMDADKQEAIAVYPNPSNGSFVIANKAGANLEIINTNGNVIFSKNDISASEQVTLDLQSGIYIVKVNDTVGKLVIK